MGNFLIFLVIAVGTDIRTDAKSTEDIGKTASGTPLKPVQKYLVTLVNYLLEQLHSFVFNDFNFFQVHNLLFWKKTTHNQATQSPPPPLT